MWEYYGVTSTWAQPWSSIAVLPVSLVAVCDSYHPASSLKAGANASYARRPATFARHSRCCRRKEGLNTIRQNGLSNGYISSDLASHTMVSFAFLNRLPTATKHVRSPDEKSLVRRLDIFLMTFGCISQGKVSMLQAVTPLLIRSSHQVPGPAEYQ